MSSLFSADESTLELVKQASRAAEKAIQKAHDPERWKDVCAHLADVRIHLAEIRRRTEAESTSPT